jgi:hypothetical protein
VPAAELVHVQADHLPADRAFGAQGMKPAAAEQLEKFDDPYESVPHRRAPSHPNLPAARLCVEKMIGACGIASLRGVVVGRISGRWAA